MSRTMQYTSREYTSVIADVRHKNDMNEKIAHRHPLVFLALILSLVIFVMPTHADLMFSAITGRKPLVMVVVTLICFGLVLIPLITGSVLTCHHPERWRKSKLSIATWVILDVAVLVNGFGWYTLVKQTETANGEPSSIVKVEARS